MRAGQLQAQKISVTAALGAILISIGWARPAEAETVTVAVVQDGPSTESEFVSRIEAELGKFVSADKTFAFKADPSFDAGWDPERAEVVVQAALADSEVDLVLGIGSLVTYAAADMDLGKPFVSTFVQRADVLGFPYSEAGRSEKENFSFMVAPQRADRDVHAFRELVPFKKLHVAVTAADLAYADGVVAKRLEEYGRELDREIIPVPVTDNVPASLSKFDADVEAVYLTRMAGFSLDQRSAFIRGLTARKVPTFSMLGHADVESGALAALSPDQGSNQGADQATSEPRTRNPEPISQQAVFDARAEIDALPISDAMEKYIVSLVAATRRPTEFSEELAKYIQVGVSPRGSIGLDKASRAYAWLQGHDQVSPDDIRAVVHDCLRHRIVLSLEATADGVTVDDVIAMVVKNVAVA